MNRIRSAYCVACMLIIVIVILTACTSVSPGTAPLSASPSPGNGTVGAASPTEAVATLDLASPRAPAFYSRSYRNLFREYLGKTDEEVQQKLNATWQQLFYGDDESQRIYYPVGADMAYILDVASREVRTEGMSYGMMIAVQLNKKDEFDKLWRFARTRMYHDSGPREGYFCWQAGVDGICMDPNPAPDGELYFAMALYFASHRWGDGEGIFDYQAEADELVREMMHQEDDNGGVVNNVYNIMNKTHNMVVFVPYAGAAGHSNPSYHLPHFYHLFALWGPPEDAEEWLQARDRSRQYFPDVTHDTTCLSPDYANWDGSPTGGDHADFRFDAWRTVSNWSVDYAWFAANDHARDLSDCYQAFLESQGITSYANQYTLDGIPLSANHSAGMVAQAAVGSLAATHHRAWLFVDELWNLSVPRGRWRYYDGLLYMLSLLHVSGRFRIWMPQEQAGTYNSSWSDTALASERMPGPAPTPPYPINAHTATMMQRRR